MSGEGGGGVVCQVRDGGGVACQMRVEEMWWCYD